MTDDQHPLHVWAQVVDDFGVEKGDAFAVHDSLQHAQPGDHIQFQGPFKVEGCDEWPVGAFAIREREWNTHRDPVASKVFHGVSLTLFICQI